MRAFTLVETVIVVALSAITLIVLGFLIYNFNKVSVYQQISAQSSSSASALMREIESLTLPADAVLQTHTFSSVTYASSPTALVLEIPSIDSFGNVVANTYDYAVFYATSTNAYRLLETNALSKRASGTKRLSSTISSLAFTYNDTSFASTSAVTVDVQTRAIVKQSVLSDRRREQIRLRNH